MRKKNFFIVFSCLFLILPLASMEKALAKIDLATLTDTGSVQTTIYRKADLTLVRNKRLLNFVKGINFLQFSWANTRIDPTSLSIVIKTKENQIDIVEISYPAGTKDLGVWHIKAQKACQAEVDITYFTSGLTWTANYTAILDPDLNTCTLINHVDITNHSGEDYADAQTRLVVGKINLLDSIRALSKRRFPYGRPDSFGGSPEPAVMYDKAAEMLEAAPEGKMMARSAAMSPKKIEKQSLSEYFLYTIEGRENIPDGWKKRLLSFKADHVKIKNIYRLDRKRFGNEVIRFVTLKNVRENKLGTTPLPDGQVSVFQKKQSPGELEFIGSDHTQYISIGQSAELNLGKTQNIKIVPKIMNFKKKNLTYDNEGDLNGFDGEKKMRVEFSNFTEETAIAEYTLRMESPYFKVSTVSENADFTRQDQQTLVFKLELRPGTRQDIDFTLTTRRGERKWQQ